MAQPVSGGESIQQPGLPPIKKQLSGKNVSEEPKGSAKKISEKIESVESRNSSYSVSNFQSTDRKQKRKNKLKE